MFHLDYLKKANAYQNKFLSFSLSDNIDTYCIHQVTYSKKPCIPFTAHKNLLNTLITFYVCIEIGIMESKQCIIQVVGDKAYLSFEEILDQALVRVSSDNDKQPIIEQEIHCSDSAVVLLPAIRGKIKFEILTQQLIYLKTIRL